MDIKDRVGSGLINFNINLLFNVRDVELQMLRSSLFHLIMTEGKKELLKKLFLSMKRETLLLP